MKTVERLEALRDNAYISYIEALRKTECLGAEIKMERGEFGVEELKAHTLAEEWLGRYRAYARSVEIIKEESQ